jgi:predicted GIY-YIG superfamily endonuclease
MERIRQGTLSVEDAHQLILERIEQETNALDRQLLVSQQIASNLTGAGVAFSGDFGATSGGKRKFGGKGRGKSTGYVPNFADEEVLGMMMGGYSKSQLSNPKTKRSTIHNGRGGAFSAFTNGHESVVDFTNSGGKKATAVIPPKGSDAYKEFAKNLAGGFIPNFKAQGLKSFFGVKGVKDISLNSKNLTAIEQGVASGDLRADAVGIKSIDAAVARGKKARPAKVSKKSKRLNFDVKQKYGGLALFGETGSMGTIPVSTGEITRLNRWKKDGAIYPSSIAFSNFQQKSFLGSVKNRSNKNEFSGLIKKHMSGPMMNVTNDFAQAMGLNDDAPKVTSASIKATGNALFPEGAEGSIFETAINAMTKGAKSFEKGLGADSQALWDFEESSNVDQRFKKKFGYTGKLVKADAKRSLDSGAWNSIGNKIFSTVLRKDGSPKRMNDQLAVQLSEFTRGGKAGGFVPSFSALHNAIQRERSAGVPMNRIRVGTNRSLASGLNPMGVGVYNTRDEPSGLGQGIRRSLARGLNPKASGGVPNFAITGDPVKGNTEALMKLGMVFMGVQTALAGLRNALGDATKENFKMRGSLDAVEKGLMVMGSAIAAQHLLGDTKIGKGLAAKNAALQAGAGVGGGGWRDSRMTQMGAMKDKMVGGIKQGWQNRGSMMDSMKAKLDMKKRFSLAKERLGGMASGMKGSLFGRTHAPVSMTDAGGRTSTYTRRDAGFFRGGKETMKGPGGTRVAVTGGSSGLKGIRGGIAKAGLMGPAALLAAGTVAAKLLNDTFNSSAQELDAAKQSFKTISETTERNINSLNKFGQAAEKAAAVYHDNNASIGQVMAANRELAKQLKSLPSEVRSRISGSFDPTEVQAAIQEATDIEMRKKQGAQTRLDTAGTVRAIRKTDMISPTDVPGLFQGAKDAFGFNKEGLERQRGRDENQIKGVMQGAFSGVDDAKFNALDTSDMVAITDLFSQIDPDNMSTEEFDQAMKDVTQTLNKFDLDPVVIDAFTKGMEEGGYEAEIMSEGIRNEIQARRKSAQEEEALRPIREALIKEERKLQRAVQDSRRELELEQSIRKAVMKVQEQAAGAFLTSTGKIDQGVKVKLALGAEDRNKQFGGTLGAATTAFGKSRLTEGIKDQDKLATAQSLQADVRTVLDQAKGGGVGSLAEGATDDLIARLTKESEGAKGARKSGIDSMIKELENLNGTSVRLEKEAKDQTKKIKETAIAQKEAARQAIRLKSFGGTGSIGNPAALDPLINQIRGSEIAEGIATRTGSQAGKDSATVNRMRGLQQMFGGELPPELREQAQAAAKADKLRQIQGINETLRPGEKLTSERMEQLATEQAANLFKGDPEAQNTKALINLTKTLEAFQKEGIEGRVDIADQAMHAADRGREGREFFEKNTKNFTRNSTRENMHLLSMNAGYDMIQDANSEMNPYTEALGLGTYDPDGLIAAKRNAGERGVQDAKAKMEQHSNFVENNTYNINGIKMLDSESGKLIQKVVRDMGGDLSKQTWQKAVAKHNKP